MSIKIKKVYSDNSYVDEMVYYTMQLGINTTLKLSQKADNNETLEILKKANTYIACIEGNAILNLFDYFPMEALTNSGLTQKTITTIVSNPNKVYDFDKKIQNTVLECMKKWYLENYEEENNYYRMLNGLPPVGYADVIVPDYLISDLDIRTIDEEGNPIPLHKLDKSAITVLDNKGILDELFTEDPINREFIKHLGDKKIDIYLARKAGPFDPLYIPNIESSSIREMYIEKLSNNRTYTMRAVYSEAYKYNSDYYDNIMAIFIVLITMIDIISRVQEFITRKEIFDIRSCEYLFQSYGVTFFEEIPLRYQIAMVKNIHTLLKYKSTSQCMVDICSIFGFENIKVFKYYLLKDRNIDSDTGEYLFTGDNEKDFTLKFIKLPLEDHIDDYIRQPSNHLDYDEITEGDVTWDGGLDHDMVKQGILKKEFNIIRTKYISIDTIYDIAKISVEIAYFFNMIYDSYEMEDELNIRIPFISTTKSFGLADTFSMLTALSYYYNNMKDIIIDSQESALSVNGFNFKADLEELAAYLNRNAHGNTEVIKLFEKFEIPTKQIPSFSQMMNMFTNNLDIREELIMGMKNADNLRIYLLYKKLYDSLMTVELNLERFKNPETGDFYRDNDIDEDHPNGYATYTEYFRNNKESIEFYYELMDILSIEDDEDRKQRISTTIDNIVLALENVIDMDEFQSLLHGLPAVSAEAVKQYVASVINFYKSYKVDFLGLNTIYYLDDNLDGIIQIIDDIFLFRNLTKEEKIKLYDKFAGGSKTGLLSKLESDSDIQLLESLYLDIFTWLEAKYCRDTNEAEYLKNRRQLYDDPELITIQQKLYSIVYSFIQNESIDSIHEAIADLRAYINEIDRLATYDLTNNIKINISPKNSLEFDEKYYVTYYQIVSITWLYGYQVPYEPGTIYTLTENDGYSVTDIIPVEYNKTYSFSWISPNPNATIYLIGLSAEQDSNRIVTESYDITPGKGLTTIEWTPNSILTTGLVLYISNDLFSTIEGLAELEVENNNITCTNRLHTAINTDGSIYNYIGYIKDTRLKSSGLLSTWYGIDTTGYISCRRGDIIRMQGINYNKSSPNFDFHIIIFYDSKFNRIGRIPYEQNDSIIYNIDNFATKYDDNGDLIELVIDSIPDLVDLSNVAYFRISADSFDIDAVIAINEKIIDDFAE